MPASGAASTAQRRAGLRQDSVDEPIGAAGRLRERPDALAGVVLAPKIGSEAVPLPAGHPAPLLELCHVGTSVLSAKCPEDHFYHLRVNRGTGPHPVPSIGAARLSRRRLTR